LICAWLWLDSLPPLCCTRASGYAWQLQFAGWKACEKLRPHHNALQGGDVIKSIRTETGARIKLEDVVPGQHERTISISAPDRCVAWVGARLAGWLGEP
jgi:hypothetical protein